MKPIQLKKPPAPGTPDWQRTITASKVPAMIRDRFTGEYLGIDYLSAFERFMEMTGQWEQPIDAKTQAMFDDAHDAEDYAVNVWKRANPGWHTSAGEIAFTNPDILPSIPCLATIDRRASRGRSRRIIEVKRPRKDNGVQDNWLVQVQFQMLMSGIRAADIVIVPIYGTPSIHPVEHNPSLCDGIVKDVQHFHRLLVEGTPPDVGDSEHAKEIFQRLNPKPSDQTVEADAQTAAQLAMVLVEMEKLESQAQSLENKLMQDMGDAKALTWDGIQIMSRRPGRFAQARVPKEQRDLLKDPDVMTPKLDLAKLRKKHPDLVEEATSTPTYQLERKKLIEGITL